MSAQPDETGRRTTDGKAVPQPGSGAPGAPGAQDHPESGGIRTAAGKVIGPDNPTFVTTSATDPNGEPVEMTDEVIEREVRKACEVEKGRPLSQVERIEEVPKVEHPKGKLLVVDGHSLAFRAYFAYPADSFSTRSGQATNAVYGFFMMLADTVRKERPTHIGVAFDVKGGTFRNAVLKQYKATRNAAPEDLLSQLPLIQKLLHALNIPYIERPGYEGDDVVASLATLGEKSGYQVLVLSGDRDSFQLIDDNITVLYPGYHFSDLKHMTPQAVHDKYKVWPHQYPDIAALRGETSDNIPGVPGVGDGYAAKWINQYGGLDGIIANADRIKGKKGEDLRAMIDQVKQNRWINAVRRNLDLSVRFDQLKITTFDAGQLDSVLTELEFGSRTRARLTSAFSAGSGNGSGNAATESVDDSVIVPVLPVRPVQDVLSPSQRGTAAAQEGTGDGSEAEQEEFPIPPAPRPSRVTDLGALDRWFAAHAPQGPQAGTRGGAAGTRRAAEAAEATGDAGNAATSSGEAVLPTIDGSDGKSVSSFLTVPQTARESIGNALVLQMEGDSRPGREHLTALAFLAPDGHELRLDASALNIETQVENESGPDENGQAAFDLGDDGRDGETDGPADPSVSPDGLRQALDTVLATRPLVVWGYKEDLRLARHAGLRLPETVFDARLACYIVQPDTSPVDPERAATALLGQDFSVPKEKGGRRKPTASEERARQERENAVLARRPALVGALARTTAPVLDRRGQFGLLCNIEMPVSRVLSGMEERGADIDRARLEEVRSEFAAARDQAQSQAYHFAGHDTINLSSPKQLQTVLFDEMGLQGTKKTQRGWSTAATELDNLLERYADDERASGFLVALKRFREQSKLEGMVVTLQDSVNPLDGRIHTTYEQTVAATGRLSSADPNLQNIPNRSAEGREIRSAFVARPRFTKLLSSDYSQVELRIMAHLSGDERLIEAFRSGADFHKYVASLVYGIPIDQITPAQRTHVKAMSYGLAYGLTNYGLAQRLEVSPAEASILTDKYFATFGKVHDYLESLVRQATRRGYTETMFGRRRYFPALHARNRMVRMAAQREALNAPIQGSAADIMKIAMVRAQQELDRAHARSRILLQIHDELIVGLAAGEEERVIALVKDAMENAVHLSVPLTVSTGVGDDWQAAAH